MAFKFPFTNYHELNLNWVLEELKKLFEDSEENVSTIETYDERLTAVETELPTVSATAQDAAQNAAAASTAAQQATATANTAQENARQAQSIAGFARQEAQAAQTAADAATQAAQQATATAQNFDGRITQAQNDASTALEASRSFENRVQAAITTANNAANTATNAQGIAMRADQNAALALDTLNAQRAELERIGAEQVELITEETEDKKTEIENLAQSVLDSIPSDYTALSALVDKKAPVIINSASGAVSSFNDGADNMKIQKLVVNIEPVQAGRGEPSPNNARPISGWAGAEIERTCVNVWDEEWEVGGYADASGMPWNTSDRIRSKTNDFISVLPNTGYYFKCPTYSDVYFYDVEKAFISHVSRGINSVVITPANCYYIRFATYATYGTTYNNDISLNYPESDTAYHRGTNNVNISVTFPASAGDSGTVYGATMTLNPDRTGTLLVDMASIDMGDMEWTYEAADYFASRTLLNTRKPGIDFICSYYRNGGAVPDSQMATAQDKSIYSNSMTGLWISVKDTSYTNAADFKTAVTGQTICYALANPQTFQLTAEQVSGILTTLYGQNNIWADAGPVSVDYPADTKLYIDGKLAELQATILENI